MIQLDDVFTASFFSNTDVDNSQLAFFYGGAMNRGRDYRIADVTDDRPDLVVITPNDPVAMVNLCEECRQRELPFMYDPGQQVARLNGDELARGMRGAYVLVVNLYEARIIYEKTGLGLDDLRAQAEIVIITESEKGSKIYKGDQVIEVGRLCAADNRRSHRRGRCLSRRSHPRHEPGLSSETLRPDRRLERHLRARSGRHAESQFHPGGVRSALPQPGG